MENSAFQGPGGREWRLRIEIGMLDRLKAVGFDIDEIEKNIFAVYILNRRVLGSVLWILCEKQAAAAGITTPEEVYEGFDGTILEAAGKALLYAVLDFFPSKATSPIRGNLARIEQAMETKAAQAAEDRLSALLSGDSLAKSASTPAG